MRENPFDCDVLAVFWERNRLHEESFYAKVEDAMLYVTKSKDGWLAKAGVGQDFRLKGGIKTRREAENLAVNFGRSLVRESMRMI